jgi:hypothetical protein
MYIFYPWICTPPSFFLLTWVLTFRIKTKSVKWYKRVLYHFLDLTLVNAYILYKQTTKQPLFKFKIDVALALMYAEMLCCCIRLPWSTPRTATPSPAMSRMRSGWTGSTTSPRWSQRGAATVACAVVRREAVCGARNAEFISA